MYNPEKSKEVYRLMKSKGYPEDLCMVIAREMNTDYTANRMLGYLYQYSEAGVEQVVDEMLAILSDRDSLVKKKEAEHAQAKISEMYRYGLK